jgi:hypothetical protein
MVVRIHQGQSNLRKRGPLSWATLVSFSAPEVGRRGYGQLVLVSDSSRGVAYVQNAFQVTGYLLATHPGLYPATAVGASKTWIKDQDG